MWLFLRRAPIDKFVMRPKLIPKKHFTNKIIVRDKLEEGNKGGLSALWRFDHRR